MNAHHNDHWQHEQERDRSQHVIQRARDLQARSRELIRRSEQLQRGSYGHPEPEERTEQLQQNDVQDPTE